MNEVINIKTLADVLQIAESSLKNMYTVVIKPVVEPYWETKIDHYEIKLTKEQKNE